MRISDKYMTTDKMNKDTREHIYFYMETPQCESNKPQVQTKEIVLL